MSFDELGDRMKAYESIPRSRLVPKMPVMMRIDGRAFHTLTKGMDKPIDWKFVGCMEQAAKELCKQVQGCQLAYVQSDEITLLLVDYQTIQTEGWFGYEVQKMCSVAAGIATAAFGRAFQSAFPDRKDVLPVFDARCWNLPKDEVVNCLIWRQQDASRNSVESLARAHFSHQQLHKKSCSDMQDMLMLEKGINWNDCPVMQKRGFCVVKERYLADRITWNEIPEQAHPFVHPEATVERSRWKVDEAIPIFTQDRSYVERFVNLPLPASPPEAA